MFLKLPYGYLQQIFNSLQYSCWENPMERGAGQATVHGVAKSQTWLKWLIMHVCNKSSHCLLMSPFLSMNTSRYKEFKSLVQSRAYVLSCVLALCDPMDCSLPGSSVHGISQARILEWVAISCSRGSSQSRDWTHVFCLAGRFFTIEPPGKASFSFQFSSV